MLTQSMHICEPLWFSLTIFLKVDLALLLTEISHSLEALWDRRIECSSWSLCNR